MTLVKTLGLAVLGATLATAAYASDSKYHDVDLHGSAHHTHADGDWHGNSPHTHNGISTHRGHSHTAPVIPAIAAPVAAAAGPCDLNNWRNNYDLQVCRVKQSGNYNYTYDFD